MRNFVRDYVHKWVADESRYQDEKFGLDQDDEHTREFQNEERPFDNLNPPWWIHQVTMYLDRAYLLGLDTPNGRQAVAKATATCMGFMESTVRVYGLLPEPGVTSGENLDNLREL